MSIQRVCLLLVAVVLLICMLGIEQGQSQTLSPSQYTTVKIKNKGWYVANFFAYWSIQGKGYEKRGSIAVEQDFVVTIPHTACFGLNGAGLQASAAAGKEIMHINIPMLPVVCYHVYGTTLDTKWTSMPCW